VGGATATFFSLASSVNYPAASPQAIVISDVNKDGASDIATLSFTGTVNILLGNGDGTLQQPRSFATSGSTPGAAIIAGDFNGDGKPDLAAAITRFGFGTLAGRGDGTFDNFVLVKSGDTEGIAAGDFNHDGKIDLAATIYDAGGVAISLGKENGAFDQFPPIYETTASPYAGIVIADFNRDGTLDIATAGGGYVGIVLGKTDGTFPLNTMPLRYQLDPATSSILSLAAGDFDGDGAIDIVAPASAGNTLHIFKGRGDGTLFSSTQITCGDRPAGIAVVDLNLDGKLDVIEANDTGSGHAGSVGVLLGKGDGTFESFTSFATATGSHAVAVSDLNGDGLPDVVVAAKDQNSVSVLLNTTR
jgi:hypothetical protein